MASKTSRRYLEHSLTADDLKLLKQVALRGDCSLKELVTQLIHHFISGRLQMRDMRETPSVEHGRDAHVITR